MTAADLGITSPSVAKSAEQAKDDMVARKVKERTGVQEVLYREGVVYKPMVASHMGSLHGDFDDWIRRLAKAVGRKKGWAAKAVERQIRGRLGAALARRAARMSLATFGQVSGEEQVILPIKEYDDLLRVADGGEGGETGGEAILARAVRDEEASEEGHGDAAEGNVVAARDAWDPGPMPNWGAEHGWGLDEGDVPSLSCDSGRWRISRPRVQALVDGDLIYQ